MKLMNFTTIEVDVDKSTKTMDVKRINDVPINIEHIFMIVPIMIPSKIAGPQGSPIGTMGSRIISSGGAAIIVDGSPKANIKRIKATFGICVATAPDINEEPAREPADGESTDQEPADGEPTNQKIIKLPVGNRANDGE